jgi:hypothetical protein
MTINDLWLRHPDIYARTRLEKGDPQRLTLPAAKMLARALEIDTTMVKEMAGGSRDIEALLTSGTRITYLPTPQGRRRR